MKTYKALEEAIKVIDTRATMIENYMYSDHHEQFMKNLYGEKFEKANELHFKLWNKVHGLWALAGKLHETKIYLKAQIG